MQNFAGGHLCTKRLWAVWPASRGSSRGQQADGPLSSGGCTQATSICLPNSRSLRFGCVECSSNYNNSFSSSSRSRSAKK
eukprot:6335957-Pyramimonas_sp.AAC.1